jgi:ketosteroid isomerase-like protein
MLAKSALREEIKLRRSLVLTGMIAAVGLMGLSACDKDADAAVVVDKAKIRETIKGDVYQLVAALNDRNAAKAATHDAPGMVGMFHGAPNSVGVEQDIATTKKIVSDPNFYLQLGNDSVEVSDAGDMAIYRAAYSYRFTDRKTIKPTKELGNWVIGYKKQPDGAWRIVWNVVTDTGPTKPS